MVRILIEAGASVSYPDRKGNSAIHLAAIRKDVKILQILSKSTSPLPDFNAKNFEGSLRSLLPTLCDLHATVLQMN